MGFTTHTDRELVLLIMESETVGKCTVGSTPTFIID